jgi:hypothetical protein
MMFESRLSTSSWSSTSCGLSKLTNIRHDFPASSDTWIWPSIVLM